MKNLLVAVDFSDMTDCVLEKAAEIARGLRAKVWLLHCIDKQTSIADMNDVPITLPIPEAALSERYPERHRQLAELTRSFRGRDADAEMLFVSGAVTHEILKAVDEHRIDLIIMIIMGSRGHGSLYDLVIGSVTKSVLYYGGTPTLIIPCEKRSETAAITVDQWEEPMATPY